MKLGEYQVRNKMKKKLANAKEQIEPDFFIDLPSKEIRLLGITGIVDIYSHCKESWMTDPFMRYEFPFTYEVKQEEGLGTYTHYDVYLLKESGWKIINPELIEQSGLTSSIETMIYEYKGEKE